MSICEIIQKLNKQKEKNILKKSEWKNEKNNDALGALCRSRCGKSLNDEFSYQNKVDSLRKSFIL